MISMVSAVFQSDRRLVRSALGRIAAARAAIAAAAARFGTPSPAPQAVTVPVEESDEDKLPPEAETQDPE